jgi:hypothetical protein
LRELRDDVGKHAALKFGKGESQTTGGAGEVANPVLVKAGTASGREPTATVKVRLAQQSVQSGSSRSP